MAQSLSKYRELGNEALWTPQIIYDIPPPNTLVRDSYDYGEGSDNYDQDATSGSLLAGVADFFGRLLGGIGSILGGVIEAGVGLLGAVVTGVSNLIGGIANAIKGIFGGTTTEWEEDPNHVFSPVTQSLEEAVMPILEVAEEGLTKAEEANDSIIDLGDAMDAAIGEQGTVTQRINSLNEQMQNQLAEGGSIFQEFQNVRSELSSATSDLSGDIQSLETATGLVYQNLNTQLWGDQGELNRINDELWGGQSALNLTLQEFRALQLQWNDEVTGWQATQEQINAINDAFREEQVRVNDQIQSVIEALMQAQEAAIETSFRTLTVFMNGGEDEYFKFNPGGTVTAKGSWVGHVIYHYSYVEESGDPADVASTFPDTVPSQDGGRTWGFDGAFIEIVQYLPAPGTQESAVLNGNGYYAGSNWGEIFSFPIAGTGDHIIYLEVDWEAVNRGSWYGVEVGVQRGSTWRRLHVWESNEYGPTSMFGNGYREFTLLTSATITQAELDAGGQIKARVYSTAGGNASYIPWRRMTITYIKPPTA